MDSTRDSDETTQLIADKLRPVGSIVLQANSVLNWERPYHAPLLGSAITMIFMLFWLIDASVLSKLSILGIVIVILDFALPIANSLVSKKDTIDEDKFLESCKAIANVWVRLSSAYHAFTQMKRTSIKSYYSILLCFLLSTAWIGNVFHNLFLAYFLVLAIALYPGLSKQKAFRRQLTQISARIASFIGPKTQGKKNKAN